MKLLSLIPVLDVGGAEVVATTLAIDARHRGHDVVLASGGGFRVPEATAVGVVHHQIPLDSRRLSDLAASTVDVRRVSRFRKPDVLHAHNVKAALVARLAVRCSVPVLTTLHGIPADEIALGARILRRSTDHLVAVSPHVAETVVAAGFPEHRVSVIENAVVPPRRRSRTEARRELGLPAEAMVGLCLARLVDQKRHDLLVPAWDAMPPGSILLVAGDGPRRAEITRLAEQGGRAGDIRMLGNRTDADRLLAAADFLVLPTNWEGMPISVLEAMSAGLPVVATRVGGVLETLGDGIRLVEPGSVDALAAGLREVAGSPELRVRLGRRGQDLVARRFALTTMLDRYADAYDAVRRQRGRAGAVLGDAS